MRLSLDAKARLPLGLFSRGGASRVAVHAYDHDFTPHQTVVPFGIYLPVQGELHLYFTTSRVTADFIVDCLHDFWQRVQARFPQVTTLLLNLDNGPENHSRRSQFIYRLTHFVDQSQLTVQLAYYPPYHSKYNPIERVWGGLEQHWNGSLLDSLATVLTFARSFRWRDAPPATVHLIEQLYDTGKALSHAAMTALEARLDRLLDLEKYFVSIAPLHR